MSFENLYAFILLIPSFYFWRYCCRYARSKRIALALLLICLCIIIAGPKLRLDSSGIDLVLILDRSLSMSAEGSQLAKDTISHLEEYKGKDNRLGIITFGKNVAIEKMLGDLSIFEVYRKSIDPESSNLNDAVLMGLSIIPENRSGKIIVLSDGKYRGINPSKASSISMMRNIPIYYREVIGSFIEDLAVGNFNLPGSVSIGEEMQFSVNVNATKIFKATYILKRNGKVISKGDRDFIAGVNKLYFVDRNWNVGTTKYELELIAEDDSVLQNNIGRGVLLVKGKKGVLVINQSGSDDDFIRAIKSANFKVKVSSPEEISLNLSQILNYSTIIFENVPAHLFLNSQLEALKIAIKEFGLNFMMTGGRSSFGMGGYYLSPLDEILPVDMIPKDDKKLASSSIAIALDRSGSMAASAGGGRTKMDVANIGAKSILDLLTSKDELSVIAVDSEPHVVIPMKKVIDRGAMQQEILSIESMGGGIYTYTALEECARQIAKAGGATRHIIIFADAADAEEPGEYISLCGKLSALGVTISVIALGSKTDYDAKFLIDLAKHGKGNIYFAKEVESLPSLFAEDFIQHSRASFVTESTNLRVVGGLFKIGDFKLKEVPSINGLNLNYNREGATNGLIALTEYFNPALSYWRASAGKVMTLSFEVDGPYVGDWKSWQGYDNFIANLIHWLTPKEDLLEYQLKAERSGHDVKVNLYYDPEKVTLDGLYPNAFAYPDNKELKPIQFPLYPKGFGVLEGHFSIDEGSVYQIVSSIKGKHVLGNPISLPYSPEFEINANQLDGGAVIKKMAKKTKGDEIKILNDDIFSSENPVEITKSLINYFILLAIFLFICDIIGRRLDFSIFSYLKYTMKNKDLHTDVVDADEMEEEEEGSLFDALKKSKKF